MPSHLTRVVFRSLIANRPLLCRGCLYRPSRPRFPLHNGVPALVSSQRRTLFNFVLRRKAKEADLPPGLLELGKLTSMQRDQARLPAPGEIAHAFAAFFSPKLPQMEDIHANLAIKAFKYIEENPRDWGRQWITDATLRKAMAHLLRTPKETDGKAHLEFARMIHQEQVKRQEKAPDAKDSVSANESDVALFIRVLCLYGGSLEARDIAREAFMSVASDSPEGANERRASVWEYIISGLARENQDEELDRTIQLLRDSSFPVTANMQKILVAQATEKKDLERAKYWYAQPVFSPSDPSKQDKPSRETRISLLRACGVHGDLAFGHEVVAALLQHNPTKEAWDAVFVWSAAIGKGVDEVERMMNVMIRRNDEARKADFRQEVIRPDIDTINDLVEAAMAKSDPYSAERYITMGEKKGIIPNARTCTLQMHYRLSVNDIDGARAAYFGMQRDKAQDDRSVDAINKLVRAMCEVMPTRFDEIVALIDDLHEQKMRVDPETVAAVALLHLQREEIHDANDLLQTHVFKFSPEQRSIIRQRLEDFNVDPKTPAADAWDVYKILRHIFPETPRASRLRMMNAFFARKRSDMACHVFYHMRDHTHPAIQANKEVYEAAFVGFGRSKDVASLELAHNQLTLDMRVEPDTKVKNCLMLAYTATDDNEQAMKIWSDISSSKEGPTYNSIALALRACEGLPYGDEYAKPIWDRLKEMDIEITRVLFTTYLGVLARHQKDDEVLAMLETVEDDHGFAPDLYMLGNWFNATKSKERQKNVEAWIKKYYPTVWTELEKLGEGETSPEFGSRQFNINRDLDP